jgi:hypothetical protein
VTLLGITQNRNLDQIENQRNVRKSRQGDRVEVRIPEYMYVLVVSFSGRSGKK